MRSKHSRLFNPTQDRDWDEYYETFWYAIFPAVGIFILFLLIAIVWSILAGRVA